MIPALAALAGSGSGMLANATRAAGGLSSLSASLGKLQGTSNSLFKSFSNLPLGLGRLSSAIGSVHDKFMAVLAVPENLGKWADSLVEGQRNLAEFNGQLAGAFAKFDLQQFQMNRAEAGALAGDMGPLLQEVSSLKRDLLPAKVAVEKLKAAVEVKVLQFLGVIVEMLNHLPWIGGILQEIEKDLQKEENVPIAASEFLDKVSRGVFDGWRNGPVGGVE